MRKKQRVGQREEQPEIIIQKGEKKRISQSLPSFPYSVQSLLTPTVYVSTSLEPTADSSGAKGARQAQAVVAALVTEDDVLLLEAAANADVEVHVPPAVLVDAISATIEGSGALLFTALAVLDVYRDELLDSARSEVLVGKGVDVAMIPVVLDDDDTSTPVLNAVADDGVLLLNTYVDGVGVAVPVILEVVNDVNTFLVAALVAEDSLHQDTNLCASLHRLRAEPDIKSQQSTLLNLSPSNFPGTSHMPPGSGGSGAVPRATARGCGKYRRGSACSLCSARECLFCHHRGLRCASIHCACSARW